MQHIVTFNVMVRSLTILVLITRDTYWHVTEPRADAAKPRLKQRTKNELLNRNLSLIGGLIIYVQLIGLNIFPFKPTPAVQMLGFTLVLAGFAISIFARKALGTNWAHGAEYQIKKNHTLTTNGIYNYIRHPIYTGLSVMMVGAEVVAGSIIFLPLLFALAIAANVQTKKEERILIEKFGKEYVSYMSRTKKLIPYFW
jgi:protein-S-isoprenylcysteine O-methyltransferase Ste14